MADSLRDKNSNDPRKGPAERRIRERRKNWALVYSELGKEFWRFETLFGRRKELSDRRIGTSNRRIGDRRFLFERRKGDRRGLILTKKSAASIRYVPEDVLEARITSGGSLGQRFKTETKVASHIPTSTYKPPPPNPKWGQNGERGTDGPDSNKLKNSFRSIRKGFRSLLGLEKFGE